MRALMLAHGHPLSRIDLFDAVWGGGDFEVTERAVDNVILRLRRKLPTLETVRGVGFRLA
jgi:DNA-binding response OmpR family regulator